jgi:AcrR family transcriptional regulator
MPKIVDKEQMRTAIMDAARNVFTKKGFQQTSMNDIAKEAHIAKGTLYLYFENKESLIESMAQNHLLSFKNKYFSKQYFATLDEFLDHLGVVITLNQDEKASIRMFFEIFGSDFVSENLLFSHQKFCDTLKKWYSDVLVSLQKGGKINIQIDLQLLSSTLFNIVEGIVMQQSFFNTQSNIQETLELIKKGLV